MKAVTNGSHRDEPIYEFGKDDGLLFWMTGAGHAAHLATNLFHLKTVLEFKHRVAVVTSDDAANSILKAICKTEDWIEHIHRPLEKAGSGKGGHYANKTRLIDLTPFKNRTVFCDADTLIVDHRVARMLPPNPYTPEVMLTQFVDWVTTGSMMRRRIEKWRNIEGCQNVSAMISNPYPAINTGVMGFSKLSKAFFKEWNRVTLRKICFMCDELAAQIIFPNFPHRVRRHQYNASVVFSRFTNEEGDEPIVWHGHGFKFVKSRAGRQLWLPIFWRCCEANFGDCTRWLPETSKKVMQCVTQGKYIDDRDSTAWVSEFSKVLG